MVLQPVMENDRINRLAKPKRLQLERIKEGYLFSQIWLTGDEYNINARFGGEYLATMKLLGIRDNLIVVQYTSGGSDPEILEKERLRFTSTEGGYEFLHFTAYIEGGYVVISAYDSVYLES